MLSVAPVQDKLVEVVVVPEALKVAAVGAVVSGAELVMVKLALETSKKMWLVPFTMIRLVVPAKFGIVTACVPSLGVAAAKV